MKRGLQMKISEVPKLMGRAGRRSWRLRMAKTIEIFKLLKAIPLGV